MAAGDPGARFGYFPIGEFFTHTSPAKVGGRGQKKLSLAGGWGVAAGDPGPWPVILVVILADRVPWGSCSERVWCQLGRAAAVLGSLAGVVLGHRKNFFCFFELRIMTILRSSLLLTGKQKGLFAPFFA